MKPKHLYLVLCFAGAVLPYSQFIPFLRTHGLDLNLFVEQLWSTRIGAFFGWDVIVSAITLFMFIAIERRRVRVKHAWTAVVATIAVGVSLGLPLYLFLREQYGEAAGRPVGAAAR